MSKNIQAVRGMNDILPSQIGLWQYLEKTCIEILSTYGYQEIRLPIVEHTELFARSIGEATDVVEKEMYTFTDRNEEQLTLRPEGTAGVVRAGIEHGLLYNQIQRLWYLGPMFRHERPQKGRYRQFHQLGVEAFGLAGPDIDVELLVMLSKLWQRLGLLPHLKLELNTLGTVECRQAYRERLVSYLHHHREQLDQDSLRRLEKNPLRILDSKNPTMREIVEKAPKLIDYLDEPSAHYFAQLRRLLDQLNISYEVNPYLVRGLDYYSHTVFEWTTMALGAQGTVCAGGRYDGLVAELGGHATPAVGFAAGLERLVLMLSTLQLVPEQSLAPQVYFVLLNETAWAKGMQLAEQLREHFPELKISVHCGGGGFKNQLKRADKSGARLAFIIAEDELAKGEISVKDLRQDWPQQTVAFDQMTTWLRSQYVSLFK